MVFGRRCRNRFLRSAGRSSVLVLLLVLASPCSSPGLPKRLVLLLDGIGYHDLQALQNGVTVTNHAGRSVFRQAFHDGYFPVSRNISTFPSTSDVAWTEILGDRPLPGYQRTYYSDAAGTEVFQNGVSTTMEFEKQMHWQIESGFRRAMGYVHTQWTFRDEMDELARNFLGATNVGDNFYAMMRATDDAQHMSGDIFAMLCALERRLQELQARYKASTGRELEVLVLSDHGNNHAGAAKRVPVVAFLERAGYHAAESVRGPKDVVVPTAGMESWVEIHNDPAETERLLPLLCRLEGVDVVTARFPGRPDQFIVMDANGGRALIDWDRGHDSFRYTMEQGDPLDYRLVVNELATKNRLDSRGFATADAWMAETLAHRYPLALERIVRAHTRVTFNPATILVSLKDGYVHAGWVVKTASRLVTTGGTHGALNDVNSDGIVLSNFMPTPDTSTSRVAALFDGFKGLRDYRAQESGGEWFSKKAQAMTAIKRTVLDDPACCPLPDDGLFLRIWTPAFARVGREAPVQLMIEKTSRYAAPAMRAGNPRPSTAQALTLDTPLAYDVPCERVYRFPSVNLAPQNDYRLSGWLENTRLFAFDFRTDAGGKPVAF